MIIRKEDYKRFKICSKNAFAMFNKENFLQVNDLIQQKEVQLQKLELQNFDSDSDISINFSPQNIEENKKLFNNSIETTFKDDESAFEISNKTENTLPDYPGEQIQDGNEVGQLAREYFMRYGNYIDLDVYSQKEAIKKTKTLIENKAYNYFFEPAFVYENFITKCDILERQKDGTFHLIEVKASTHTKMKNKTERVPKTYTSEKDKKQAYDIAYQYFVLTKLGYKISKISLMLLDSSYLRMGDIDFNVLFAFNTYQKENVTLLDFAKALYDGSFNDKNIVGENSIEDDLNNLMKILEIKDTKKVVSFLTNKSCLNNAPLTRFNYGYCKHFTKYLGEHFHVFELYRGMGKQMLLLHEENVESLVGLNSNIKFNQAKSNKQPIELSDDQKRQVNVINKLEKVLEHKNVPIIKEIYHSYKHPIYMLDFETMKSAVPKFDFSYSYQQVPFQYSVHIILDDNYDYKNEETLKHFAYLASGNEDPRYYLILKLYKDLNAYGVGSYIAYNSSFEKKCIVEMIDYIDNIIKFKKYLSEKDKATFLKAKEFFALIVDDVEDLMDFLKIF